MWLLPFLLIGAIAAAVARRSKRAATPSQLLLPSASVGYALPPGPQGPQGAPGPIATLGEMLSVGQTPPPTVVLCAIAEAQAIGRHDLASDIAQAFVEPVLRIQTFQKVQPPMIVQYERGSCAAARGGRNHADACFAPQAAPPYAAIPVATTPPRTEAVAPAAASSVLPQEPGEDEISALLNSDPARFMEVVSRTGTMPQAAPVQAAPVQSASVQAQPSAPQTATTPEPGSPIPGVPDVNWRAFIARLSRESPQFNSARHVGQYRQRRERLAELGLDPASLVGSPQAQRAALDLDLVDAYRHGAAGDLFSQHLGHPVSVPGREGTETISLSGVLGVIQVAGLEGAVNWLERASDRKRYPHTTQTFLHTNGVF
jgi:hypothetical protein